VDSPDDIRPPIDKNINIYLALAEQQHLDNYSAIVDHAVKQNAVFDAKLKQ